MPFTDSGLWIPHEPTPKPRPTLRRFFAKAYEHALKLTPILISLTVLAVTYEAFVTNKQLAITQHRAWVRPEGHVSVHAVVEDMPLHSNNIEDRTVFLDIPITNHGDVVAKNVDVRVCHTSEDHCPSVLDDSIEIAGKESATVRRSFVIQPSDREWKLFSDNDSEREIQLYLEISYSDDFGTIDRQKYYLYVLEKKVREAQRSPNHSDL
jgi:hypothetical protein